MANKFRSTLTALGIIFGVASVIAMLAVGTGAEQEILKQIEKVGVNNIIIQPVLEDEENNSAGEEDNAHKMKNDFSPGLTIDDANSIAEVIPSVAKVGSEIEVRKLVVRQGQSAQLNVVGVNPVFFDLYNITIKSGKLFNETHEQLGEPVCVIGSGVAARFFSGENPLGKYIKCGRIWLKVTGVLEGGQTESSSIKNLGVRDYYNEIFLPVKTALLQLRNRALITDALIKRAAQDDDEDKASQKSRNYHQLDKIVVQVYEPEQLKPTSEIISRMLARKHKGVEDFEVIIPELLLKQQQETKELFNWVLGAIAGISLLVGGIGIMNIMLASVQERMKEIGLRRSIGATKELIILQFLAEAILISLSGGIVGVLLGGSIALLISKLTGILTIITLPSIMLSFGVASLVGLIFGIAPARKAAELDPIKALRYE